MSHFERNWLNKTVSLISSCVSLLILRFCFFSLRLSFIFFFSLSLPFVFHSSILFFLHYFLCLILPPLVSFVSSLFFTYIYVYPFVLLCSLRAEIRFEMGRRPSVLLVSLNSGFAFDLSFPSIAFGFCLTEHFIARLSASETILWILLRFLNNFSEWIPQYPVLSHFLK